MNRNDIGSCQVTASAESACVTPYRWVFPDSKAHQTYHMCNFYTTILRTYSSHRYTVLKAWRVKFIQQYHEHQHSIVSCWSDLKNCQGTKHACNYLVGCCLQRTGCNGSALTYLCSMMGIEPVQQLCLLPLMSKPKPSSFCFSCGTVKPYVKNIYVSLLQPDSALDVKK